MDRCSHRLLVIPSTQSDQSNYDAPHANGYPTGVATYGVEPHQFCLGQQERGLSDTDRQGKPPFRRPNVQRPDSANHYERSGSNRGCKPKALGKQITQPLTHLGPVVQDLPL